MNTSLRILAASLLLLQPALGTSISWLDAEGDVLVNPTGTALDSSFIFEIGTFGSFVPTDANLDQWAANWKVFDRAVAGDGWNPALGYFTSNAQLSETVTPGVGQSSFSAETFQSGEVAYLWVYNALDLEPTSQWALVRDSTNNGALSPSWLMPTADDNAFDSIDWDLLQADQAILGMVNGVQGGGDYTPISNPGGGVAWLQLAAVPEPGSCLLLGVAGLLGLWRRRR
ncbi:MAG: PEP-CTERM sorting domain-containing protein [Verrucomicrobiota bacterium]